MSKGELSHSVVFSLIVFVAISLAVAACNSINSTVPVSDPQCPGDLVLGPTDSWYETDIPFSGIDEIHMVVVLSNEDAHSRDLQFSGQTFQLWSVPRSKVASSAVATPIIEHPPIVVNDEPSGVVPHQSRFLYDLTIDVSGLPSEDPVLGFRPVSRTSGTMRPRAAPVIEVTITCY